MTSSVSRRTVVVTGVFVSTILTVSLMLHHWEGGLTSSLRLAQLVEVRHATAPTATTTDGMPPPSTDALVMRQLLFRFLETPQFCCKKLNMFGGAVNQGFVDGDKFICLDEGFAPPPGDCLIYSIGINNEWSFDKALVKYGCEVHAFDPSMKNYKKSVTEFGAHFYQIGLGGKTEYDKKRGWHMMTLRDIRAKLGHTDRVIEYLKADIESAEWAWLEQEPNALDKVNQVGLEIHMFPEDFKSAQKMKRYYDVFQRIYQQGFRVIHTNPNRVRGRNLNLDGVAGKVTNLYELVWMRVA